MTDQERKVWILWQIRKASYRYPLRSKAFAKARTEKGIYRCNGCNAKFRVKDVQLDHIVPVVDPEKGFTDWNDYINRMFCDLDGFQILCKDNCHKLKTQNENVVRRAKLKERKLKKKGTRNELQCRRYNKRPRK